MHVCMYACMHVCMYGCMYVCMYLRMYVCMYARMYVRLYVRMYVCLSVCLPVNMYVSMYVCMYVSMYACMLVCMCAGTHVCMNDVWLYACRGFLLRLEVCFFPWMMWTPIEFSEFRRHLPSNPGSAKDQFRTSGWEMGLAALQTWVLLWTWVLSGGGLGKYLMKA